MLQARAKVSAPKQKEQTSLGNNFSEVKKTQKMHKARTNLEKKKQHPAAFWVRKGKTQ